MFAHADEYDAELAESLLAPLSGWESRTATRSANASRGVHPRRARARLRGLACAPRRISRHLDALAAKSVSNPG
ncbi:MAG: hypothetical protein BGO98_25065 [Myxococcales bacterium 68-20]|nr:MAG: hypothetical protein BGO98_25065 [Myxococcales bacterium 68-20]